MKQLIAIALMLICTIGFAQVSVTATSGTLTGSYSTLNAAFAAINAGTHQGAINISITGNTTEPSPPTSLLGSGVGSANYTSIHISPSGGSWTINSAALPFAYRGIIELFGAQHVTIDGDPTGTGIRHLTFDVAMTSDISTSAIRLGATNTNGHNGAAYDTVRNCNIIGGRDSANSTVPNYGIIVSGNSTTSVSTPVAYGCNYNSFVNNSFTRSYYGIYMLGYYVPNSSAQPAVGNSNTLIQKNQFGSNSPATSNIFSIYMYAYNTVYGTDTTAIGIIDSNDFTGSITADTNFYAFYSFNNTGKLVMSNNNIHDISNIYGGVNGFYSYSQLTTTAWGSSPGVFFNNTMQNCIGTNAYNYFMWLGSNGTVLGFQDWNVHNNKINNLTSINGTEAAFFIPSFLDSLDFYNNTITNLSAYHDVAGVVVISNASLHDNIINGLSAKSDSSFACGMYVYSNTVLQGIYNNMISNITAKPYSMTPVVDEFYAFNNGLYNSMVPPATAMGMWTNSYAKIYNNTIALNTANQSGTMPDAFSAAIYCKGSNSKIQNNIFYNNQNSTNAIGFYSGNTSGFSTDTLDYNEYYAPYGDIGYAGSGQVALLNWQAATGQDLHSINLPVPFISTSDVHIDTLNSYANNVFRNGIHLDSVRMDIDGQTRNNPPCIGADEFFAVNALPDSLVWPGDADNNRIVDNTDLLPIGLGYDSTGPIRTVTGIIWQGDLANNWGEYFSVYAPTVNFNHADCNGDGVINANDTTAIIANFSLTHAKTNVPAPWRSGIPAIKAVLSRDTVYAGDTLYVNFILGDSITTITGFYGLAFTYNFDPLVVDSTKTSMTFGPSWIGSATDKISISKTNNNTGEIKAAVTRIDHTTRTGNGPIGTATFKITTDNISGKDYSYYTYKGYVSDITLIDNHGNVIPVNGGSDSSQVGFYPNGIREMATEKISLQPNPARDHVIISAGNTIEELTISNVMGQQVLRQSSPGGKTENIDIAAYDTGIYFVEIKTAKGTAIAKLVIEK